MSLLPWRRHGPTGESAAHGPVVLGLHAWGSSARRDFAARGFAAALADRGVAVLACDLPGHADAAEVTLPAGAEPAGWTAGLVAADVRPRLWERAPLVVVGHRDGALIAAHLAAQGEVPVGALVLVGCDGDRGLPLSASAARQLADPRATVWDPAVSTVLADLRTGDGADRTTLAAWLERVAWPATPRLAALRVPVMVVADATEPRQREHAPRWAAWFHDASVVTVGGDGHVLAAEGLHDAVADLAHGVAGAAG